MGYLLWFLTLVLTIIPAGTCFVYYHRRLGTRRESLRQTIESLQLEELYMCVRHGGVNVARRREEFDKCFDGDFRAGNSAIDYLFPACLATILGLVGWFLTFSRAYPQFTGMWSAATVPDSLAYGFAGAFFAGLLTIFDAFRTFNLTPDVFYALVYRLLFSSTAAFIVSQLFKDTFSPVVAFGVGLFPVEKVWKVITERASQVVSPASAPGQEPGIALAVIQGLEDQRNRKKLVDVDISTVQALATADPFWLFFQTTFPLRTIMDMMDKAILYLYIGKDGTEKLRLHGVNGVIELVALVNLAGGRAAYGAVAQKADPFFDNCDRAKVLQRLAEVLAIDVEELKAFLYNLYYDPLVKLLYTMWGKYLNPDDLDTAPPESGSQAAAAG